MLGRRIAMIEDLSAYHYPVTPPYSRAAAPDGLPLSGEQVDFFNTNGFLSGIDVLAADEIDVLRSEVDEIVGGRYADSPLFYEYNRNESGDPELTLFHALGAWRVSPAFHDLIFHPTLVDAFSQLLCGQVRFWHDQVFVKPAGDGGIVAWHQDYSYWTRTRPIAHLTAWIALDDSTVENGCVHYVPGSHRWDLLPKKGLADSMNAVSEVLSEDQRQEFRPVASVLKAGQASFHHPLALHGSYENRSSRPRRGAVVNVFLDGVVSDSDEPLLEGVPPIGRGAKIEGRFFPLLTGKNPDNRH